jgi:hypothetical protein
MVLGALHAEMLFQLAPGLALQHIIVLRHGLAGVGKGLAEFYGDHSTTAATTW